MSAPGKDELADKTVYDVVVRLPKTLSAGATRAQARAAFDDDHVHMLLITHDGRLLGTLVREDLPDDGDESSPALDHAVLEGRTIPPDVPAEEARLILVERGERRVAVVTPDGALLGLLCLKRRRTGFCSDQDVQDRAASRLT